MSKVGVERAAAEEGRGRPRGGGGFAASVTGKGGERSREGMLRGQQQKRGYLVRAIWGERTGWERGGEGTTPSGYCP